MNRKQALSMYLLGTFGQVLGVSLLSVVLRAGGVKVDFTSSFGDHRYYCRCGSSSALGESVSIRLLSI